MFGSPLNTAAIKTTSYKVVVPFYAYAALSFLVATVLLLLNTDAFSQHYFHPKTLAITHTMALGWGTMIIFGASHQLVPVVAEGKLFSETLAYITFGLAAIAIPLLVHGFFVFDMGGLTRRGGELMVLAILFFLTNISVSIFKGKSENIHAVFVFTALLWLVFTVILGLLLVYNFTSPIFSKDFLHFLPLHAHAGIVGWFLLLVTGMAGRLIPMFLISKYTNPRLLWVIYGLINIALFFYLLDFFVFEKTGFVLISNTLILTAVALFLYYCRQSYKKRLRRLVDNQVGMSLLSVGLLLLPVILLFVIVGLLITLSQEKANLILAYGFMIFFGWLSAIIFGMTFKTLPFIVWNKVYHRRASLGKTPSPKDLFDPFIFKIMGIAYLAGFVLFAVGILSELSVLLSVGAAALIVAAVLYNWNVLKVITHQPIKS